MYKLVEFEATNVIGFYSGLGKRTFKLDLREFKHKDLIAIVGTNAAGKSTFLSLVHPLHTPSDDRLKFVIPGKEGSLIRIYEGDDGTTIVTKCIYSPSGDTHTAKCYISIQKSGDKEPVEMNPNGNVRSYTNMLYTYFGINKEYVGFATYNDAVNNIVTQTGGERKESVSTMIPNTKKFEVAYNIVNERYKELRNMIRNVSQKILALRDEDSLLSDLERVSKDLNRAKELRDESIRDFAKVEGRVKELSHGDDINQMIDRYNDMVRNIASQDSALDDIRHSLMKLYRKLGIDLTGDGIEFDGIERVADTISKLEIRAASSSAAAKNAQIRLDEITTELVKVENEQSETESALFGIETQDVGDLEKTLRVYQKQIAELTYPKVQKHYQDMSYDEVIAFSRTVSMVDHMIQALYEEYGDLVSKHFMASDQDQEQHNAKALTATIETLTAKRDAIYRSMIEKEQYRKFQDILDKRPATCHDDRCPFIANALKWQHVSGEIEALRNQYGQLGIELASAQDSLKDIDMKMALRRDAQQLMHVLDENALLFKKYLHLSVDKLCSAIAHATWGQVLDMIALKQTAAILSEKDHYIKLSTITIPEVERAIELAKAYGTNRDLLQSQLDRLKRKHSQLMEEYEQRNQSYVHAIEDAEESSKSLVLWKETRDLLTKYTEVATERLAIQESAESKKSEIETITRLVEKCKDYDTKIRDAELIISELTPVKQQIQMDLSSLMHLREEKDTIELNFLVVDVIRTLAQPGRGVRKELINIYMYDIYQTANQLLMNTFDGKLYLREFIITDKEFTIPYVYNGSEGSDIAYASSSQQSTIAMALSLAIISKMIDKYGIVAIDEADRALSPENKAIFIDILAKQMRYIGISQAFVITHSPEYYESAGDVGFLAFPGAKLNRKSVDVLDIAV